MKAELKFFIMISPGKLKKWRAIRIKWCRTETYWQDQARLHVVLFCPSWLRVLCSISFVNVPDIWGSQVSQLSEQMYLYNDCSSERMSYGKQELQKIFCPLYLGGILSENL